MEATLDPAEEQQLGEQFQDLIDNVRKLRDTPTRLESSTLYSNLRNLTVSQGITEIDWELYEELLLESVIWSFLCDEIFASPFQAFGLEPHVGEGWMQLFGRETLRAYRNLVEWPTPDDLSELWRKTVAERLDNLLQEPDIEAVTCFKKKRVDLNIKLARRISLFTEVPTVVGQIGAQIVRTNHRACDLAIMMAKKDVRLQLYVPDTGDMFLPGYHYVQSAPSGSLPSATVAFVANPGLVVRDRTGAKAIHPATVVLQPGNNSTPLDEVPAGHSILEDGVQYLELPQQDGSELSDEQQTTAEYPPLPTLDGTETDTLQVPPANPPVVPTTVDSRTYLPLIDPIEWAPIETPMDGFCGIYALTNSLYFQKGLNYGFDEVLSLTRAVELDLYSDNPKAATSPRTLEFFRRDPDISPSDFFTQEQLAIVAKQLGFNLVIIRNGSPQWAADLPTNFFLPHLVIIHWGGLQSTGAHWEAACEINKEERELLTGAGRRALTPEEAEYLRSLHDYIERPEIVVTEPVRDGAGASPFIIEDSSDEEL